MNQPVAEVVWGLGPCCWMQSTPLDCACRGCSVGSAYAYIYAKLVSKGAAKFVAGAASGPGGRIWPPLQSEASLSCRLALVCCSLAVLSSAVSEASLSCRVALTCCSLAALSSGSLRCQSLTTGSAHLLQCALPPLRVLCSSSALSRSRLCLNLRSLCSAVSSARRVLSRSLLRRSLSSLCWEDSEGFVASIASLVLVVQSTVN